MAGTSADLLLAARLRFARDGYDGTSVRDIAADADVNVALIYRYFGSKEGLFVEALADDSQFREMREGTAAELPARMLDRMLERPNSYGGENPLTALLRSSGNVDVAQRLRAYIEEDLTSRVASLTDRPDRDVRADLFIALVLGIGVMRTIIRKRPLSDCAFDDLWPHVEDVLQTLLSGPVDVHE